MAGVGGLSTLGGVISAVVRPFRLALFEGEADPPPARSRVHFGVTQVVDLILAVMAYAFTATQSSDGVGTSLISMIAIAIALPIVLRDRWPLAAWRASLALIPLVALASATQRGDDFLSVWPAAGMYGLVMYAVAVRCDREITIAACVITAAGIALADLPSLPVGGTALIMGALFGYSVRSTRATPPPAPKEPTLWRWPGKVAALTRRTVTPFRLALYEGEADPPPDKPRWLSFPAPDWLPLRRLGVIQVLDVIAMWVLFGTTLSQALDWNNALPFGPQPLSLVYFAAAGASLPVALRDVFPLAAWRLAVVMAPVTIYVFSHLNGAMYPVQLAVMYLLVTYSAAVRSDRRVAVAIWFITVLVAWIADPNSMPITAVVVGIALLFGYNVRARRLASARLTQEEARSHQAEEAQAVLEERARIARELHDIVAHHMSVIAIHAEAVPLKASGDPAQLEAGLAEIRGLSLDAIAQLRQVLGVLRDEDGRADTAPQPGLDRIEELVATARAAGVTVRVALPEEAEDGVPPALGLSVYRIVQESLSNAMRHAPGAAVTVALSLDSDAVRLRVANEPGREPGGPPGAGQGLVGMRERAALLGGTLEAEPMRDGGFAVSAVLPMTERET